MEWKEIDKYLNSHYKNYLVVNQETQDLIEDVLDEYSNIDKDKEINAEISGLLNPVFTSYSLIEKYPKN